MQLLVKEQRHAAHCEPGTAFEVTLIQASISDGQKVGDHLLEVRGELTIIGKGQVHPETSLRRLLIWHGGKVAVEQIHGVEQHGGFTSSSRLGQSAGEETQRR
ncbi:MAG TPA: hypothetical protein VFY88_02710, partial [Intrasporangium sp.]|nr:hypothetical protein [Intrasporangium sp.]